MRTSDSIPEILPIFVNSLVQTKLSFDFLNTLTFSFARSKSDIQSKTILTIIFEYPIPFTPRFRDMGNNDTRNVSQTMLSTSLAKVKI